MKAIDVLPAKPAGFSKTEKVHSWGRTLEGGQQPHSHTSSVRDKPTNECSSSEGEQKPQSPPVQIPSVVPAGLGSWGKPTPPLGLLCAITALQS